MKPNTKMTFVTPTEIAEVFHVPAQNVIGWGILMGKMPPKPCVILIDQTVIDVFEAKLLTLPNPALELWVKPAAASLTDTTVNLTATDTEPLTINRDVLYSIYQPRFFQKGNVYF